MKIKREVRDKIKLETAIKTLEQIAALPRGGLAKRLAVSTLRFLEPEPAIRHKRIDCHVCGKNVIVYTDGSLGVHGYDPASGKFCEGAKSKVMPPYKMY